MFRDTSTRVWRTAAACARSSRLIICCAFTQSLKNLTDDIHIVSGLSNG